MYSSTGGPGVQHDFRGLTSSTTSLATIDGTGKFNSFNSICANNTCLSGSDIQKLQAFINGGISFSYSGYLPLASASAITIPNTGNVKVSMLGVNSVVATMNGAYVAIDAQANFINNTWNTSVAGQVSFFVGFFDSTYTKVAGIVLKDSAAGITAYQNLAYYWSGNVLTNTGWTTNGGIPTTPTSTPITMGSAGYGVNNLQITPSYPLFIPSFFFSVIPWEAFTNRIVLKNADPSLSYTTITSGGLRVPIAGVYQFNVTLNLDSQTSTGTWRTGLHKSTNDLTAIPDWSFDAGWLALSHQETTATRLFNASYSAVAKCNVNDYIKVFVYFSGDNTKLVYYSWNGKNCSLSGHLITITQAT